MDLSVLYSRRWGSEGRGCGGGRDGGVGVGGAGTYSHCKASNTGRAVADVLYLMCVLNSIKPLSLKPGGGWLIFFQAVPRGSRCGPQSDTVHIAVFVRVASILCLSRIITTYKSVYLPGLFGPK